MLLKLFLIVFVTVPVSGQVCKAYPDSVGLGDATTIHCSCDSVSDWQHITGSIDKLGATTAKFTAGYDPGSVTITPTCTGSTAANPVLIQVLAPAAAPAAPAELCRVSFERDTKRPTRVDNEGLACLDDIALTLEHQVDTSLVLVGQDGKPDHLSVRRAQLRAVNVKDYLVKEKGIDASRILLLSGDNKANKVNAFLLPPGANFQALDTGNVTPVDENAVKAVARKQVKKQPH